MMLGFYLTSSFVLYTGYLNCNRRRYQSTGYLIRNHKRYLSTGYLDRNRRRDLSTGYLNRYRRRYHQCFMLPLIQTCLTFVLSEFSDRKNIYPKEFSSHLT